MFERLIRAFPAPRIAVSFCFLTNGFIIGGWALHIPVLAARLEITESTIGFMVLAFGIGSLLGMPTAGILSIRYGARTPMLIASLMSTPWLLLTTLPSTLNGVFVAVFLLGLFVGFVDVVMNAHAVVVEKVVKRGIMSSCHGFWSLGGFLGAAFGGVMISQFGATIHAAAIAIIGLGLIAMAWPRAIDDRAARLKANPEQADERFHFPKTLLVYGVGLATFLSMVPEGSALDWGAIYMRDEMGAGLALAGLAFGVFSGAMAIMRFSGDYFRGRFGALTLFRASVGMAAFGLMIVSLAPTPWLALLGFALAGFGIANLVPLLFVAAGNLPGVSASVALTIVTATGYSGMLVAPPLIGFIAEYTGLAPIFGVMAIVVASVVLIAPVAASADISQS